MEDLLKAVSTVGFPIAVSIYLLWDGSKSRLAQVKAQEETTQVLSELKILIQTLVK